MSKPLVDRQVAVDFAALPTRNDLERWVDGVLSHCPEESRHELTIRFVEETESRELNRAWRGHDKSTNVLSFPFEAPPGVMFEMLGDLVICARVVEREAGEQHKRLADHFAHMVVHGTLHLMGHDHIDDEEAERMESLERQILASLDISDPYAEPADSAKNPAGGGGAGREDERPRA